MSAEDKKLLAQAGFALKQAADTKLHLERRLHAAEAKVAFYERRDDAMKVASEQVALGLHPEITDFSARVQGLMSIPQAEFEQIKSAMGYLSAGTGKSASGDIGSLHDPRGMSAVSPASENGNGGSTAMDRFASRVAQLANNNHY